MPGIAEAVPGTFLYGLAYAMNDRDSHLDKAQGWLLLAPFLYLCLFSPWDLFQGVLSSPYRDAPDTVSIGVGFMALAAIPALCLSLWRAWHSRDAESAATAIPIGLPLLLIPMALAAYHLKDAGDSFNAWRALVALVTATAYVIVGSSLRQDGREVLRTGLPVGTLLLLASVALGPDSIGSLQNTGDLSEAALPGAVLGAGAFLTAVGPMAFVGFAALLAYGLFAGLSPVHAGTASLAVAAAFALLSSVASKSGGENGRRAAAKRARLLLVAVLLGVLSFAGNHVLRSSSSSDSAPKEDAYAEAPADPTSASFGGVEFRRLTWAKIPALLAETGLDGAGPGQFQAVFPPFRDPAEIEFSSFGRLEPTPQEVEHAHNDYATALVEYGWIGGGAFLLFMLLSLWRSGQAIGGEEKIRRDFGIAAVAITANAAVNSPLLYSPLAAMPAFLVLGVVASPALSHTSSAKAGLWAHVLVLACLAMVAGKATSFFGYGRAMAEIKGAVITLQDGRVRLEANRLMSVLEVALEHRPDAFMALEKKAEVLRLLPTPSPALLETQETLRRLRPHSVATLINSAQVSIKNSNLTEAWGFLDAAIQLDPQNPDVLRYRTGLAFRLRDAEAFKSALNDLGAVQPMSTEELREFAYEALVGCRLEVAQPSLDRLVLRTGQAAVDVTDPNSLFTASQFADEHGDEEMRRAYMSSFNYHMALDHLQKSLPAIATGNARQSLQRAESAGVDTGAIRLIYAAALAADEEQVEAEAALDQAPIRREDGDRMAPAVRAALDAAGLLGAPGVGGSDGR